MASLADAGPAAAVDLTGPSLSVLGVAFAVGIFRYRMFDLVPVARASIVENMGEGYVLLDREGSPSATTASEFRQGSASRYWSPDTRRGRATPGSGSPSSRRLRRHTAGTSA